MPLVPAAGGVYTKSEYLMDSPQHVIKTVNYRNSEAVASARDLSAHGRTAKSEEADAQLMYVVIKPASPKPPVKKYNADNQAIYMTGVVQGSGGSGNNEGRTPRLNLASGAYPVYYSIAAANGKFGRNIRALTKEEISRAGRGF